MTSKRFLFACLLVLMPLCCMALDLKNEPWPARWIYTEGASRKGYGVYFFRKEIQLDQVSDSFMVHISADQRYQLYVNGKWVAFGPTRGDYFNWYYQTLNLQPYLHQGVNQLAVVVRSMGDYTPTYQFTHRTAFILQGAGAAEQVVNTDKTWKSLQTQAYSPVFSDAGVWIATGPNESVDFAKYPFGWEKSGVDESNWKPAVEFEPGIPRGLFVPWYNSWGLTPSPLPEMERTQQRFATLRKFEGMEHLPASFAIKPVSVTIPAGRSVTILLDNQINTTAFPCLTFSGGTGARVKIRYAEALYTHEVDKGPIHQKDNRNDIEGKFFRGTYDEIRPDGGFQRTWMPLEWRSFRYVQLEIKTGSSPLTLHDIYSYYTGYPFKMNARFESSDASLKPIFETGWRTARLCAHEHYMDCPFYEQLQYIGDTRIQALVTLFNSGDIRLVKHALTQLAQSQVAEGITQSRYPSSDPQFIPPFSLWWVGMLHDYNLYVNDSATVAQLLPTMRRILSFFESHQNSDGSLKRIPYWNFTDWTATWAQGVPPRTPNGESSIIDLQWLLALQSAAELEQYAGLPALADRYKQMANVLSQTIRTRYWDAKRGLFADTPGKQTFSQHANVLAVLAGVVTQPESRELMQKVQSDKSLTAVSIYFRYYLNRAMVKAGLGDEYLDGLQEWKISWPMALLPGPKNLSLRVPIVTPGGLVPTSNLSVPY